MIEKFSNIVYDTNFVNEVPGGGYPVIELKKNEKKPEGKTMLDKTQGFFDRWFGFLFKSKKKEETKTKIESFDAMGKPIDPHAALKDQVRQLIEMDDDKYNDRLLTSELRNYILENEKEHNSNIQDYFSHIASSYWKIEGNDYNVSGMYGKTYYVENYPSYMEALWTRDVLAFDGKRDFSFFMYPEDDGAIQGVLKTKATQLKAEINEAIGKGITVDSELEVQYRDVQTIRQKLATREERYFETGTYINLYTPEKDKLNEYGKKFEQKVSGLGVKVKSAYQRMDEGFKSALPICVDGLGITRSTISSSLAGSFPFISTDMVSKTGIFYGMNQHTGSLVIFDRFDSKLPNMNSVILATSGAGKSFTVKLEILRYLLNGIDVMVIDPENEYVGLVEKVGGTYINISTGSNQYINPFDIPPKIEDRTYGKGDLLRGQVATLIGLINILIGGLTPQQEGLLDKALQTTYELKGMTMEAESYIGKQPPLMQDLFNVLEGMEGNDAADIAIRLSKYVTGTFAKIFNNYTNVDINNRLTVFSIRDLEDALKTPAMYNALNFIWTKVRSEKRKRLLVADEAWIMLQNEVSANFLYGLIKRARKYGLGITTISQDIEDFTRSQYGKPIISNSAMQILLKQSTTSIKSLESLIGLSETEKQRLVAASIGEGLIFAGSQHVAIKIMAAPHEKVFITTNVGEKLIIPEVTGIETFQPEVKAIQPEVKAIQPEIATQDSGAKENVQEDLNLNLENAPVKKSTL